MIMEKGVKSTTTTTREDAYCSVQLCTDVHNPVAIDEMEDQ